LSSSWSHHLRVHFTRFDLTSEKRYSLAPATKKVLRKLDDVMFFKVYLSGDLPPLFNGWRTKHGKCLMNSGPIARMFNTSLWIFPPLLRKRTGTRLTARFWRKAWTPLPSGSRRRVSPLSWSFFPGAIVTYRGHESPVQFLSGSNQGEDPNMVLNNSVQALEYKLASAIQVLTNIIKQELPLSKDRENSAPWKAGTLNIPFPSSIMLRE